MSQTQEFDAEGRKEATIARLREVNADLLAALQKCESALRWHLNSLDEKEIEDSFRAESNALDSARAAIAKATS